MPLFTVIALEKFMVQTVYRNVEAKTGEEAAERCRNGSEAYEQCEIQEGEEEWLDTVSVEQQV